MKKILNYNTDNVILLDNIDNEDYYAVQHNSKQKGIVNRNIKNGEYFVTPRDRFCMGAIWEFSKNTNLKEFFKELLFLGYNIYQFSNSKELHKWISED